MRVPGALVVRSEGALLYFNIDHVRDRVMALVAAAAAKPAIVVLFMGSVPYVDLAGAELLTDLRRTFGKERIEFRLAEVRGGVREALIRTGAEDAIGLATANQTVSDVLHAAHFAVESSENALA